MSGTVFFSVDVESSGRTPWTGRLLTVGVEAIDADTLQPVGEFYVRVAARLDNCWYQPEDYSTVEVEDLDTFNWWQQQTLAVREEAYLDHSLMRHSSSTASKMLCEFVRDRAIGENAVFVANPVAFDKTWIDWLYSPAAGALVDNPFHYRSLCLRSMKFGLRRHSEWGGDRETHEPKIPHHALWDAKAQALDLIAMINERQGRAER